VGGLAGLWFSNSHDFALALTGFILLAVWKMPPWTVVLLLAVGAAALRLSLV